MWLKLVHHAIMNQMCIHIYIIRYKCVFFYPFYAFHIHTHLSVFFVIFGFVMHLRLALVYSIEVLQIAPPPSSQTELQS